MASSDNFDNWEWIPGHTENHDNQQVDFAMGYPDAPNGVLLANDWNWASHRHLSDGGSSNEPLNNAHKKSSATASPLYASSHAKEEHVNSQRSAAHDSQSQQNITTPDSENGSSSEFFAPGIDSFSSSYDISANNTPYDAPNNFWNQPAQHEYPGSSQIGPTGVSTHASLPSLSTMTATNLDFTTIATTGSENAEGRDNETTTAEQSGADSRTTSPTTSDAPTDAAANATNTAEAGVKVRRYQAKSINYVNGRAHFVPDVFTLMDPIGHGLDTNTYFKNIEGVREFLRSPSMMTLDPTIPQTSLQKQAIVKIMLDMMNSVEYAQDNDNMIATFDEHRFPNIRLEAVCWQLLEATIDRHRAGPLMTAYSKARKPNAVDFPSFADRLTLILEVIASHKTICKHLMDPPYINFLVDDPAGAQRRVEANKTLNARKGAFMKVGKQILGSPDGTKKKEKKEKKAPPKGKDRKISTRKKTIRVAPNKPKTKTKAAIQKNTDNSEKSEDMANTTSNDGASIPPTLLTAPFAPNHPAESPGNVFPQHIVSAEASFPLSSMALQRFTPVHGPLLPTPYHYLNPGLPLHSPHVTQYMAGSGRFPGPGVPGNFPFSRAPAFNNMMLANPMGHGVPSHGAASPSPSAPSTRFISMHPHQTPVTRSRKRASSDVDIEPATSNSSKRRR